MIVLVYVNDLVVTGSNEGDIELITHHLKVEFDIKDLGQLKYYLEIELAYLTKDLFISQRKYTIDLFLKN